MAVEFRVLKFKHFRKAQKLEARVVTGEAEDEEIVQFAADLVVKWDFLDVDTGEPIPLGEIDELSSEQVGELTKAFSDAFRRGVNVPKMNAEPSPSTSMPSDQEESQEIPPTG